MWAVTHADLVMLMGSLRDGGISDSLIARRRVLLLDALTDEWETPGTVADRCGLSASTGHQYLLALADVGSVEQRTVKTRVQSGDVKRIYEYRKLAA